MFLALGRLRPPIGRDGGHILGEHPMGKLGKAREELGGTKRQSWDGAGTAV